MAENTEMARHYGNMRFAMFTVFTAIVGALMQCQRSCACLMRSRSFTGLCFSAAACISRRLVRKSRERQFTIEGVELPRFVAFLRGVSPVNCKMSELKRCLENAGFTNVKTILASGNVAFDARASSVAALERKAEAAITQGLGRGFYTIVRPQVELTELIEADPFVRFEVPRAAKRVVTFVRAPTKTKLKLPYEFEGVHIFAIKGCEIFTAYEPHPRGPVFMRLIEKTFGKDVTTRTWDTVRKCAEA